MCYYAYQKDLVFFHFDTLIGHANKFRYYYGLEYCDISGGEATIYGSKSLDGRRTQLEDLVGHCADIGLKPTIITHGQNNTEALVRGVEEAGLEDWLVSMHGMEHGHNLTVVNHAGQTQDGWQKLVNNLGYCQRPVRFNTTLQNFNYQELPALAKWLAENRPPTVWNLIQFNPFYAWQGQEVIEFQEQASVLAPYVAQAVELAEAAKWEVNVRYFPFCIANQFGFARNVVNFYQTQYDPWEWDLVATERLPMAWVQQQGGTEQARRDWIDRMIALPRNNSACVTCAVRPICEGPTEQYQARYGTAELTPFEGQPFYDISHFERSL